MNQQQIGSGNRQLLQSIAVADALEVVYLRTLAQIQIPLPRRRQRPERLIPSGEESLRRIVVGVKVGRRRHAGNALTLQLLQHPDGGFQIRTAIVDARQHMGVDIRNHPFSFFCSAARRAARL